MTISLTNQSGMTLVPNTFIDVEMRNCNELQLKVYFYILRNMTNGKTCDIPTIADFFNETEKDVERAITYFVNQNIFTITQANIIKNEEPHALNIDKSVSDICKSFNSTTNISPLEFKSLQSKDETTSRQDTSSFKELAFVAQTYVGRPLSPSDLSTLEYIYTELKFSSELLEFLIEYCAGRDKKSFHYIQQVAIKWSEADITTVEQAKNYTSAYTKRIYTILNALGRKGTPATAELDYIEKWYSQYGFEIDIILEACKRSTLSVEQNRFNYADGILKKWVSNGVHHFSDIAKSDQIYKNSKTTQNAADSSSTKNGPAYAKNNPFLQYQKNNIDYGSLEQQLLKQN